VFSWLALAAHNLAPGALLPRTITSRCRFLHIALINYPPNTSHLVFELPDFRHPPPSLLVSTARLAGIAILLGLEQNSPGEL
jgi:hypothetical protein